MIKGLQQTIVLRLNDLAKVLVAHLQITDIQILFIRDRILCWGNIASERQLVCWRRSEFVRGFVTQIHLLFVERMQLDRK